MDDRTSVILRNRGVLAIAGDDRRTFLQGLISNDINKVDSSHVIYSGFLTAQGRYLHDFFVAEIGDTFYLDCEADRLDDLRRRLSLYKLRAKVTLTPASDRMICGALFGPKTLATLGLPEEPGLARPFGGGIVYVDPRLVGLGARALIPKDNADALASAGFKPGAFEAYDRLRLSLGVPDGSRDLPVEKALLLENGFDELNGVDWKKGCYVGQELTARMKYRALVRKRLTPVRIDGPVPQPGTPITLDDQEAGEMRSAQGSLGLALLRLDIIEQADRDGRPLKAGEAEITPVRPAWA
ncbi:MAG TPA: folate-binding protein [Alphaproteobacteria bacterium]